MALTSKEIIGDITDHIRKSGGDFAAWSVAIARDWHDPTLFRMYESRLYRWLSPDPVAGDISNPQSLIRYAYVLNNPTNLIDPLGLQCIPGAPGYEEDCPTPPASDDPLRGGGGGGRFPPRYRRVDGGLEGPLGPRPGAKESGPCRELSRLWTAEQQARFDSCMRRRMAEADAAKRAYQNEVGSRMLKRMGKGPLYGAVRGAIWGATAGTAEFGIGAVPGAAFGASVGAVVGAGGAAIWGGLVVEPLQELGHDYYVDNLMFKIGGNDPVMDCIIEALSAPPAPPVAH